MWFTRVSINNPVFATMVMAALCVLGLFSYSQLRVERLPDITPPIVFVVVAYPGASPEAVETELTRPIELSLNGIAGVKMIRSNSLEGRSETVVEFQVSADMNRAVQDVRDKVAAVQPSFPRDAKQPYVSRFDGDNAQPTVYLSLLGQERSARELSLLADQVVRKRLERATGVARVDVGGLTVRQVRIDLDPQRLRALQLTPGDVSTALQRANADMPVGLLSGTQGRRDRPRRGQGEGRQGVRRHRRRDAATACVIRLADLGTLVEREREPDSISRDDGVPSISFQVFKQQDANIVETGEAIKAAAEELRKTLPPGVELRLVYADSDWVARSLSGVKKTLIEGALLTIAIVFLFLHSWRSTIITGLTLPIAVISAFIAVYLFGFTLNFMTMMALSLCIGLLIDDAIVVRENIVRHIHLGLGHRQAAQDGTDEIGLAVMATTFAICAVFVPVAFMKGIIGKFFFPFGVTVAVAVLVSLFVSFTLDPMLSSIWKRSADQPAAAGAGDRPPDARDRPAARRPARRLRAADPLDLLGPPLSRRWCRRSRPTAGRSTPPAGATGRRRAAGAWRRSRRARSSLLVGVASFAVAIAIAPLVGTEFIPESDDSYIRMNVTLPVGTSLQRGSDKLLQVEDVDPHDARDPHGLDDRSATPAAAAATRRSCRSSWSSRTSGSCSQREVEKAIRKALEPIPGIEVTLGNRPIFVSLLGPDPAVLEAEVLKLQERVAQGAAASPTCTTSVKPGIPGLRGAPQARRRARARPDDDAARDQPARLRQRRRRHLLDLARRRAGRRRAAPAAGLAREHRPARRPAGRLREGRHADRAGERRRRRAGGEPGRHQAPGPAAAPGDLRRHRGPAERRRRRRRAEDRQGDGSCRPATASTSAARRATSRRRSSASCSRSARR